MRKEEILSLKWDNVDMVHGFIRLDRTKNGERREILINGTLRNALIDLPTRFTSGYVFADKGRGSLLGHQAFIRNGMQECRNQGFPVS